MPRQKLRTEAFQGVGAALGIEPGRSPEVLQTDEAFPVVDLKRFVEAERAVQYTGLIVQNHAAPGTLATQVNPHDTSSWTGMTGPLRHPYNEQVPRGYDVLITGIGCYLDTAANWTSTRVHFRLSGTGSQVVPLFMASSSMAAIAQPAFLAPFPVYWPSHDVAGEFVDLNVATIASGGTPDFYTTVYMMAAPRGVLPRVP